MNTGVRQELVISLCGCVLLCSSFGTVYSIAVLFPRLHRELNIPLWHLTACFSVAGAMYFSIGLAAGWLTNRIGARSVVRSGQVVLAVGLVAASYARTETWFDAVYVVTVGVGVGLTYVPVTGAVQVLCTRNTTFFASIASAGIGIGSLILPPLTVVVLRDAGWQPVLWLLAACSLVASFAAAPLHRTTPNHFGYRRFCVTSDFKVLYAAQTLASLVAFVPFAHMVTWATVHHGMTMPQGASLISSVGLGSTLGRLALGAIGTRCGEALAGAGCSLLMGIAMIGINLVSDILWLLSALMFIFGVAYGGFNSLIGPLAMQAAGKHQVAQAVGALSTSRAVGVLLGPWLVGIAAMRTGQYLLPFISCGLIASLSSLLMFRLAHMQLGRSPLT